MEAIFSLLTALIAETYGIPAVILFVFLIRKLFQDYSPPSSAPSSDISTH